MDFAPEDKMNSLQYDKDQGSSPTKSEMLKIRFVTSTALGSAGSKSA